jgi:hypothetical protein
VGREPGDRQRGHAHRKGTSICAKRRPLAVVPNRATCVNGDIHYSSWPVIRVRIEVVVHVPR